MAPNENKPMDTRNGRRSPKEANLAKQLDRACKRYQVSTSWGSLVIPDLNGKEIGDVVQDIRKSMFGAAALGEIGADGLDW
ncbi:hypothetical protein NLI96_g11712 [Meripilus lineatus]|uniref:Uncharacterized protein n=1 Tax=Meripilus lineatus TaxID=2056292 RepID=A0AAD5YD29_9APHY|nr:hypothetical protein NLI96_g11712 [Physisporinus lineatus]